MNIFRLVFLFLFLILVLVFLQACSSDRERNFLPDRFKIFMQKYFDGYDYVYQDIKGGGNYNYGNQYGRFEIKATDLSRDQIQSIYAKLEKDGWYMVDFRTSSVSYCHGKYTETRIHYPLYASESDVRAIIKDSDYVDVWNIYIHKSTTKLSQCNKNFDAIDFTKL